MLISFIAAFFCNGCNNAKPLTAADYLSLGERYLLELNYEQAVVQFQNLIEIDPMNPRGYTGLAEALVETDRIDEALAALQQGYEALPDDDEFLEKSVDVHKKIINRYKLHLAAYIGLIKAYISLDRIELALEALNQGLENLPDSVELIELGASAALQRGKAASTRPALLPIISVSEPVFRLDEGSSASIKLNLEGDSDAAVTVQGVNEEGEPVSGFGILSGAVPYISVDPSLPAGLYDVTVTAKNATGESSFTFMVSIKAKEPPPFVPAFNVSNSSYSIPAGGGSIALNYTLTGSEPISVSLQASDSNGAGASGYFSINKNNKALGVSGNTPPGIYSVTLTASNDAGKNSAAFKVEVTAAPAPEPPPTPAVAPKINVGNATYWIYEGGGTITLDYTVSGTAPISYSLQAYDVSGSLNNEFSIGNTAKTIVVGQNVYAGEFTLQLTASNEKGSSTATFNIIVMVWMH